MSATTCASCGERLKGECAKVIVPEEGAYLVCGRCLRAWGETGSIFLPRERVLKPVFPGENGRGSDQVQ